MDVHELLYLVSKIKVQDVMTKNPITVPQNYTIEETAEVLLKNKISGVPVVDQNGGIVGTITQTDLFCVLFLLPAWGHAAFNSHFNLMIDRDPSKKFADVIRRFKVVVSSASSLPIKE